MTTIAATRSTHDSFQANLLLLALKKPVYWTAVVLFGLPVIAPIAIRLYRAILPIVGSRAATVRGIFGFYSRMLSAGRIVARHTAQRVRDGGMTLEQATDYLVDDFFGSKGFFYSKAALAFTHIEPLGSTDKIDQIKTVVADEFLL